MYAYTDIDKDILHYIKTHTTLGMGDIKNFTSQYITSNYHNN